LFGGDFEYFVDTDFPDLFKAGADGVRRTPGLNLQDAYFTVKVAADLFKIDTGYMLPPLSHNAVQGATSLYGWDYFANTFRHNQVFNNDLAAPANPVGRDLGVQLRGLVADGLLEYRLGMFQGRRKPSGTEVGSQNMFRVAGRLQLNLLDPEPGFFYAGTYLGTKKILSFGVSYDFQDTYNHFSADGLLDLPVGPGVLTAQVNVSRWNGDDFLPAMLEQTALMGEAGYLFDAIHLSPIFRFEKRWVAHEAAGGNADETRVGGGLALWPHGHNFNLKAFFMHIDPSPATHAYNAFNLQAQLFVY
jgi:hypothetical protein